MCIRDSPKTFDKVFRSDPDFKRFKLGEHTERFTIKSIEAFIDLKETKLKKIWEIVGYLLTLLLVR